MKKRKEFILGIKNNEIIIASIELTNRNGYNEFTASFDTGRAFDIDKVDDRYIENYFNEYWDSIDDSTKLDILEDGEQTKVDAMNDFTNNIDYNSIIDCSCTNYEFTYNNITVNFETISCGQHDVRLDPDFNDMIFTDKILFNVIMNLWDAYHLKKVNDDVVDAFDKLYSRTDFEVDSSSFYNFIKTNINWEVL